MLLVILNLQIILNLTTNYCWWKIVPCQWIIKINNFQKSDSVGSGKTTTKTRFDSVILQT